MPQHAHQADEMDQETLQAAPRRGFLGAAATLASGALVPVVGYAQSDAPTQPVTPGTVSNEEILRDKDRSLKVHTERPLNGSAPGEFMSFDVTPTNRLFMRNNLLVPALDAKTHVLRIKGLVDRPLELRLEDLKKMELFTTQAMLECAGSGRTAFTPVPRGTPWQRTGGMGCPRWTGVRLRDVLARAGVKSSAEHVAFGGADFGAVSTAPPFIRSIPLSKAMEEHTMIAIAVNDEPLPAVHGFPMRALVPGWVGSASIKWLNSIELLAEPFKGPYMDDSYRVPRKPVAPGSKMPADSLSTEDWPVKSIITSPAPGMKFKPGETVVFYGYAWAGEHAIRGVDVSFDGGKTWREAQLKPQGDKYAWRGFAAAGRLDAPGTLTCMARARDDQGRQQPVTVAWNPHGYFWNAIHSVSVLYEA